MSGKLRVLTGLALAVLLVAGLHNIASAQGRGRGGGAGRGAGGAGNPGGGRPSGVGVDRGIGTSSDKSVGRADTGRATAGARSEGRSTAGLERARLQRENARRADIELQKHPQMATRLHTTANDLREGYRVALISNPELKFGHYVAANRLAANLGARQPNITREAILAGLARGDSLGETLQDLGLSEHQAKEARNKAEREIKESKRQ